MDRSSTIAFTSRHPAATSNRPRTSDLDILSLGSQRSLLKRFVQAIRATSRPSRHRSMGRRAYRGDDSEDCWLALPDYAA
jgi:hypothetical protein